ncbi:hypothetical protein ACIQPQ_37170 [Streptomyces sp. NPDC091281]|uniref:hypothetical protein n=1 Tax=Streptomyces sp. NPDC091281 TaxID=3365985 RepID=UPI0038077C21
MARLLDVPAEVTDRLELGVRVPQERIDRHALRDADWWALLRGPLPLAEHQQVRLARALREPHLQEALERLPL